MTENEKKAKYIAGNLITKNGVIVNSGTIAILSALKLANIKPGDNVLINGYSCYSLFEAIMNVGANPIFVIPKNFFNITYKEIESILKNNKIDCFIAAHQFGIVQDIKEIKKSFPKLIIIEDIAQGWNIKENETGIGAYSDYVVTSFGITKPLSFGQAGAVFSNNKIQESFDFHDRNSRNKKHLLLPYALYECQNINEIELVTKANEIVEHQRRIARYLSQYFENNPHFTIYKDKNMQSSTWQRFPIIINDTSYIKELEDLLNEYGILFQWQNDKEVWELDMVKEYNCKLIENAKKPIYALIRTRQNSIDNVKKLVRSR